MWDLILDLLIAISLHVTASLESCSSDQKKTLTICSKLIGRNKKKTLPDFPPDTLSSTFDEYFHHKLTSTLINRRRYTTLITPTMPTHSLNVFSVPSMSDIGTLLKATKISSPLDPIPLSLLHEITESLTIPLNNIFCESIESGTFPTSYKHALITPLHKKPNLDPQSLNNYRPISNLSIFSKTLERIVAKQLTSYLISHKIPHIFQSAYLPSKSTETAPAKISSDIITNLDKSPNFFSFSSLNPFIFPSCNTRCSPRVSHYSCHIVIHQYSLTCTSFPFSTLSRIIQLASIHMQTTSNFM